MVFKRRKGKYKFSMIIFVFLNLTFSTHSTISGRMHPHDSDMPWQFSSWLSTAQRIALIISESSDSQIGMQQLLPSLNPFGVCFVWLFSKNKQIVQILENVCVHVNFPPISLFVSPLNTCMDVSYQALQFPFYLNSLMHHDFQE